MSNTASFLKYESEVRSYCRAYPVVFEKAKGPLLFSEEGVRYIDFFAGAGSLNYGHNPEFIKQKLIDYLSSDNIIHGLDMYTVAKRDFIEAFHQKVLEPRGLDYRTQFCGPTGTNAVEAALKLARKVKGRQGIFSFQGGFHGMTMGSLSATGNKYNRAGAGTALNDVTFMPYPHGFMSTFDTIEYIDQVLTDTNSGIETPAAILLETVQAEGGVIIAPVEWLQRLKALCEKHDILMIIDDIQVGCGRTGSFFSFERAGIIPDIVTLSKSISGYGLPLAVVLLKPELDQWLPGEHNGTFRGNQLAFVGGTAALTLWGDETLQRHIDDCSKAIESALTAQGIASIDGLAVRGLGMIWGVDCSQVADEQASSKIASICFEKGLIVETAGRGGHVIKLLPPLNIDREILAEGLGILTNAIRSVLG